MISLNTGANLRASLRGSPLDVYDSNLRLAIPERTLRTYPDASVYGRSIQTDADDPHGETFTNPVLVVDVFPMEAGVYHYDVKARSYRRVPSLKAIVLVFEAEPHVEVFSRLPAGVWRFEEYDGLDAVIRLPMIDVELPMADVYYHVDFTHPDL